MVKKKGKSKRITLKDKYKIQKRVIETNRKKRKVAKRESAAGVVRHEKNKNPGIPNSWPFKAELLREVKQEKERAERRKEEDKERKKTSMADFAAAAEKKRIDFEAKNSGAGESVVDGKSVRETKESHGQSSRRAYLRELKKVIDASDVIIQVLDARDPLGTRIHPAVEAGILSRHDRRMVLVLNKIDLVPKSVVADWLAFLRKSRPTVALKAGTGGAGRSNEGGKGKSGVGRSEADGALGSSSAVGVDGLLQLLKNYARCGSSAAGRKAKSKTCITVGIVGYPNVGKSSILNSLKRFRAVGVSPKPGFTTSMCEVVLDKNIRLIDSPGVVFDDGEDSTGATGAGAILRNSVDSESIKDPIPAIEELLQRCSTESLMMTYGLPAFPRGDAMAFLAMIARSKGKVLKGGVPDKIMSARLVLRDWNRGKIPYYTAPPVADDVDMTTDSAVAGGDGAKVLTAFSEEFDINKIFAEHDAEIMKGLEDKDEMDFVKVASEPDAGGKGKEAYKKVVSYLTKGDEAGSDDDAMEEDGGGKKPASKNSRMEEAEDFDFGEDD